MLRLLVLRHARAVPHDEAHDRERPLTASGREDATRIGRAMRERCFIPGLVLCSPAARALQTWEAVAAEFASEPVLELRERLYDASEGTILATVKTIPNAEPVSLCIGHNPGLERFVRRMVRTPADAGERRRCEILVREFSTAALAVLDFEVSDWCAVVPATGALTDLIAPADLGRD